MLSQTHDTPRLEMQFGGIVRADRHKKEISLAFTGHEFADGAEIIRATLKRHNIKANFFFTGDFYRTKNFAPFIRALKNDGHYLGAHSNKHLLYAAWEQRDSLLVTKEQFQSDLLANYEEMRKFGIAKNSAQYFMPPYEWYNDSISTWSRELGLTLVNFTSGTHSNADWTYPELGKQYVSGDTIYNRILRYEETHSDGLNGFLLLMHIGTDPRRTDKLYDHLDNLIRELQRRGYHFKKLDQLLSQKPQ
ncbi:MAG: polysaccharide deacetylase family protein [Ignavibacteriales bacterium]|nr:polysaccharide deacetylase family protein [Ignavibacteriales bacterium]